MFDGFIPFLNRIKQAEVTLTLRSIKTLLAAPLLADAIASCLRRAHEGLKQRPAACGYIL